MINRDKAGIIFNSTLSKNSTAYLKDYINKWNLDHNEASKKHLIDALVVK